MSELKPCPFCGDEAEAYNCGPWLRDHFMWYVKCSGCGSMTPNKPTEAEAAAAWNTRHVETCRNIDDDPMYFCCSKCGSTCTVEYGDGGYGSPRYCPSCGRKVEG